MGLTFSNLFDKIWGVKGISLLVVGLDNAGKSTMMTQLKLGDIHTSYPVSDFMLKTVEYRDMTFRIFNLRGSDEVRNHWKQCYTDVQGIVFVVDSNDHDRIQEARKELERLLSEEVLRDALLLVMANKQDLPDAMNAAEVTDKLGLHSLRQRAWYIQSTCAPSSDGLYEGFEWLANSLRKAGRH